MVLYLSGPITGINNFHKAFEDAEIKLMEKGYEEIINPAFMDRILNKSASHKRYMTIDFMLLDFADVLVQLPGWEKSIGCNQEYGYALGRDMIVLGLEELLDGKH